MSQENTTLHEYNYTVAAIHQLRVNVKTLAAEAKIIKQEERRAGYRYQMVLSEHRRGRVRDEARYAQLALAMMRGKVRSRVELGCKKPVDIKRLKNKLDRFYYGLLEHNIQAWVDS